MAIRYSKGLTYITSRKLESFEIKHGFFMRHGGCSPNPWNSLNMATSVGDTRENVTENRNRISNALSIDSSSFFDLWQVHGNKVVITDKPRKVSEDHIQADSMVTQNKNLALLMLFADCVPILFFDPKKRIIAAAHAGWMGTINQIARETINVMTKQFKCLPEDIISVIGPSICQKHYEVGLDVIEKVRAIFSDEEKIINMEKGKYFLDLPLANKVILEKCGVATIEMINICTKENVSDWFSHRGEKGITGRFAGVISL